MADEEPKTGARAPIERRPRHRGRRIVRLLLFLAALVVGIDALVGDRGLLATIRARRAHEALAAEIAKARAENARLRDEARRLREDPATIEAIARRELGLIQPGEKLFIIRDSPRPRE